MRPLSIGRVALVAAALAATSCGSAVRQGTGTSFLVVNTLEFARGATPDDFTSNLLSDVVTVVDDVPTVYNDLARATFSLGLKDPGSAGSPNAPTQNQFITLDRYRVRFTRTDGRNTQGVDVPYEFEGAFTVTIGGAPTDAAFTIVRHVAKREAPLLALRTSTVILSTIADITFYGKDQTGRAVTASARASIDFGNFADPSSE